MGMCTVVRVGQGRKLVPKIGLTVDFILWIPAFPQWRTTLIRLVRSGSGSEQYPNLRRNLGGQNVCAAPPDGERGAFIFPGHQKQNLTRTIKARNAEAGAFGWWFGRRAYRQHIGAARRISQGWPGRGLRSVRLYPLLSRDTRVWSTVHVLAP